MNIQIKTPASCGELLEGEIEGCRQLISLPINLYNELIIHYDPTQQFDASLTAGYEKAWRAAELFYHRYQLTSAAVHTSFRFTNQIPIGKGMASSTSDIVNMISGLNALHRTQMSAEEIAQMAQAVEPSDSTMFSALYLQDFIHASRFECMGEVPSFRILLLELPDMVDTVTLYAQPLKTSLNLNEPIAEIRRHFGIESLGAAATQSALNHQEIHFKPWLPKLRNWMQQQKLRWLNIAHSGSVVGIWLNEESDAEQLGNQLLEQFGDLFLAVHMVHTVTGGARVQGHS